MPGALELIAPARMGPRFRLLLASSWISNLGDGAALTAGPLLIAAETRSPFLVAAAALLQRLPWLLLGLHAGAIADRVDRRLLVAVADLSRAMVLGVLAATILTGVVAPFWFAFVGSGLTLLLLWRSLASVVPD